MKKLLEEWMKSVKEEETKFLIISFFYMTFIVTASLLSSKITSFGFLVFSVGVLPYSFSFTMTDAICEIWGKERAKRVVTAGLFAMVLIYLFIFIAIILPAAPIWELQGAYTQIFLVSSRVLLAGFIAYIAAQYHDVWLFALLKKITKDKYLWLRNNLSTIISQFIDTTIIAILGFYGVIPLETLPFIIMGWWIVKILLAFGDTPIIYLLVKWVKGEELKWLPRRHIRPKVN